jgi:N-acetylglucosamine-6-phosphate deacetylase
LSTVPSTALCDATIFTGETAVEGHALLINDGKIVDITRQVPDDAEKISCKGQILAPGLIDAQVNGGGNILLNNTPTLEACLSVAKAHRAYGTTSLLLTCISDSLGITKLFAVAARRARLSDAGILGMHFEGPHLSMERRGVHSPAALRQMADDDLTFYKRQDDEVFLITVAPENAPADKIKALSGQVIVALGHTGASIEDTQAALQAGATGFTHLFNGMAGLSARAPGVAGVALDDRNSWCSIIADGHHVSPEMIRLAFRAKPFGKVILVSDAMAPAATDAPEPFKLYGRNITVADGRCVTEDGKLAGASITLLDAVRYCVKHAGIELEDALRMASTFPAAFLGVGDRLGKLLPGFEARVIGLSPELGLKRVWTDA